MCLCAAADENGNFTNNSLVLDAAHFGVTFTLTATGQASGYTAQTTFTDGFGLTKLRLGTSATDPENYIFTAGDSIFPEASVDPRDAGHPNRSYKFTVMDAAGTVRNTPTCTANPLSGGDVAVIYTVQAGDPVSNAGDWTFLLEQFTNSICTTLEKDTSKTFDVAKATIYGNLGLSTLQSAFGSGQTAYVTVAGLNQGQNDWSITWFMPSGAAAANTGGGDCPDSTSTGAMPDVAGSSLRYPPRPAPDTGTDQWNWESKYESGTFPAFGSSNAGTWSLKIQKDNTHFVTLTVFSVDTTASTVTINQKAGQADPANTSPINFTAVFNEAVTGFTGSDVTIAGTAGGTKTVIVTDSGDHKTYNVRSAG